jgi:hypothetical protein
MPAEARGWVGSVLLHLAVVGLFVGASWWASRGGEALEPVDPLIVDLNGIPGRRPGEVGKREGVARGSTSGDRLFKGRTVDVDKIRRQQQQDDRAQTPASGGSSSSRRGSTSTNAPRESVEDFMRGKGQGRSQGVATGGVSGVALGRSHGTGENGGDGGTATAQQLYAGEVLARFRSAWADLVAAEGEELGEFVCGVKVAITASGTVTFAGWLDEPRSPKAASLVRRAVGKIGNCGKPPEGQAFTIEFSRVTATE